MADCKLTSALQLLLSVLLFVAIFTSLCCADGPYQPTWDSLDARPLPAWYDQSKFGIFIHWGVFSVPSFSSEWFWWAWKGQKKPSIIEFMEKNYPPGFTYADFAPMFTTEFYNSSEWAEILESSGAKYVVLTSKHHEGYTMWPSNVSWNWNAMDVGPHRDLVGELAKSVRTKTHLRFGLYHSLFEWFNPLWLADVSNNLTTRDFVTHKTMPELYDIVNKYEPEVIWSDGDWSAPPEYWQSRDFLAWLYNESPVKDSVVTNDRWGQGAMCHHGGYYTCQDGYNPGHLVKHKWENCFTLDKSSWGYRRRAGVKDYHTIEEVITTLAETVSCGGNLLLNIGPTADGRIPPIMEERLRQMGAWLKVNGAAIYGSSPWQHQNDTITPGVWYTTNETSSHVYAIVLTWPHENQLLLGAFTDMRKMEVRMLGYPAPLDHSFTGRGLNVAFPVLAPSLLPCRWAWVLEIYPVA